MGDPSISLPGTNLNVYKKIKCSFVQGRQGQKLHQYGFSPCMKVEKTVLEREKSDTSAVGLKKVLLRWRLQLKNYYKDTENDGKETETQRGNFKFNKDYSKSDLTDVPREYQKGVVKTLDILSSKLEKYLNT